MNRRDQNRTIRVWKQLKDALADLDPLVLPILARGSHDSGIRRHRPFVPSDRFPSDPEAGTPAPPQADETGEQAIRDELQDATHRSVMALARHLENALNIAKAIRSLTPEDAAERALRSVPDCLACGKPVQGRIKSGYDEACYKAWQRAGYPDRLAFERSRRESVPTGQIGQ